MNPQTSAPSTQSTATIPPQPAPFATNPIKNHTHRIRAVIYICVLVLTYIIMVTTGLAANNFNPTSKTNSALSTMSGMCLLIAFIFTIPFLAYAIKYWRAKLKPLELPPVDSQSHAFDVRYTTNPLFAFFAIFFLKTGTLSWVNSEKNIKFTRNRRGQLETVFETSYKNVEKFVVNLGYLGIKVGGKTYTCSSAKLVNTSLAVAGTAVKDQLATVVMDAVELQKAGIPELAERLRLDGVKVLYSNIKRSIEGGFAFGFVLLFLIAIVWSIFLFAS